MRDTWRIFASYLLAETSVARKEGRRAKRGRKSKREREGGKREGEREKALG